ncbi:tripartite tricarboxylate transporter substrate-binding protein [Variovorax guangxiensis]|uniref:Bug family tripartite tricarboxylate transporter substrate binding protein n=1 Tax=Variovorax guangxiensis TaxID=1775474 RepID=UPI00285837F0|nr:tripartite tricarboxylate transporter substrate-binding protein [Variovorax guangxiensis]MDR6855863.1 tripartite-type tricarboxylate transporter receptor subunit TctC [Variovorax guangxiensis]
MRIFFLLAAGLLALAATAAAAGPAAYPAKPLKVMVPFPAGSGTDTGARVLGQWLTARTGQPVIVDNRPGASGFIAAQAAAAAAPDGYTLLLTTNTTHAANPAMFKKLPYDPVKDFEPVSTVGSAGLLLLVPAASPYQDIGSFLARLRAGGKRLHFGAGNSSSRIAGELLKTAIGADLLAVPYKGTPQALTDLMGGQVDFMFCDIGPALPLVASGKLRALATSSADRELLLRDVPTLKEAGLKDFEMTVWSAVFVPAKTPKDTVAKLSELLRAALADPAVRQEFSNTGGRSRGSTPDELRAFVKSEMAKWAAAVKTAGIQPE